MASDMRLREWARLQYRDPIAFLSALNEVRRIPGFDQLPEKLRNLRSQQHKSIRELRQAAIFCMGIGQLGMREVWVAPCEHSDYDVVACFREKDVIHYAPIQLKELVPEKLNSSANLQDEIDKLRKYTNSSDLIVAFHINRQITIEPHSLNVSGLPVRELWFFGASDETQTNWMLIGDVLSVGWVRSDFIVP